jgi:hypothetical protein
MRDDELHRFKSDIPFVQYAAERYGYERSRRESSVSSHVLRHRATGDKIVVRKDQDGHWTYFSVRDDRDHGTIVDFEQRRGGHASLGAVRLELRRWLGSGRPVTDGAPPRAPSTPGDRPSVAEAFAMARVVASSAYLHARGLRPETLVDPRFAGTWRVDARGNVLFAHTDDAGALTGFEVKNRGFTGFAPGGTKMAWQSAARPGDRALVVTESAIDALSYHQLHLEGGERTRYLSTAGAPSRAQVDLLAAVFGRLPEGSTVVAAVDADEAGRKLVDRLETLAHRCPRVSFRRDAPDGAKDWNEVLQRIERDFICAQPPLPDDRRHAARPR